MPRDAVQYWCDMLDEDLAHPSSRSHALPVDTQILTAFEFYSSGSFQWVVGNAEGMSKSTVSRTIESVTNALCRITPQFIAFDTDARKLLQSKVQFSKIAAFPNVVGAVDGTHIPILSPSAHEEAYVNRKVAIIKFNGG